MRRRQASEISVYSTSAIDLFCSALGVFMVVFFMAMADKGGPVKAHYEPGTALKEGETLAGKDHILTVVLKWERKGEQGKPTPDVDLVVYDKRRNEWFFYDPDMQGSKTQAGGFVADDRGGNDKTREGSAVCREVWTMVNPEDGDYVVYVRQYGASTTPPAVEVACQIYLDGVKKTVEESFSVTTVSNDYGLEPEKIVYSFRREKLQALCTITVAKAENNEVNITISAGQVDNQGGRK